MRYDLAGVPIKSQLRRPVQGIEGRFRIRQLVMRDYWATQVVLTLAILTADLANLLSNVMKTVHKNAPLNCNSFLIIFKTKFHR